MPLVLVGLVLIGQGVELIERTLAIVSGRVITLSDERTAVALGLVDGDATGALDRLIDRELMLREVDRYLPPEPPDAAVESRLAEIGRRQASPDALRRTLEAGGFSEARLRAWVRDDLRIAAYLGQRFAAAGAPSDQEVAAAYERDRAAYERKGVAFETAAPMLREQLSAERRRGLIADWLADLRRRAEVARLP
jgi:hypothetical protein